MARFTLPRDIYFGAGALAELKNLKGCKKAFIVTGGSSMKRTGFLQKLEDILKETGLEVRLYDGVEPDPSIERVMDGAKAMREFEPDVIVAIGGGSAMDTSKLVSLMLKNDITLEEMLKDFKDNFTNKYVLYDASNKELNVARSIAGIKDYIPVDISLESLVKSLGFELGIDARGMSEEDCFDTYKNEFNNTSLIQQNPETTQEFLTDYGIAGKFFFFWPDNGVDDLEFRSKVHTWAKKDSPIFGWVPVDEPTDINVCSTMGQFMIASDWARNMSVFAAKSSFGELRFNNPIKDDESIVAQDGKHYVTIMMSDGDNIQTWYNTFPMSNKYLAAERGDFKMGWSINPSLSDLGRNIMNYVYDNRDENDFYVCSVSGQGYMNPRVYPDEALESFVNGLSAYLRRTDLSVVQILDGGPDKDVIEQYAIVPELNGGIYCYGDKYAGGRGSVYWANDKPFVAFRETLWDADTSVIANRINNYSTDVSNIEAYTAINLHPWSMEYKDVVDLVNKLDEHVEVVTADEFIRLIKDNVEHKDTVLI